MLDALKEIIRAIPDYVKTRTIKLMDADVAGNMYQIARDSVFNITKHTFFSLVNLVKRRKVVQAAEVSKASQSQLSSRLQQQPTLTFSQGSVAVLVVTGILALFLVGLWFFQPDNNDENKQTG
jgi:hypothetical protein